MEKTINVGIVGCGWFGNFHIDNLLKMENVNVCALAAQNEERLYATAKKVPSATLYKTGEEMLEKQKNLDAAIFCVTPARHGALEKIAAEKGVNIYVEKPIGLDMDLVNENIKAIEKAGIVAAVGYQGRYNKAMNDVKEFLNGRKIGYVEGKWLGNMPGPMWWRDMDGSGGQIVEQCTHIFDILRYLVGEMTEVYSMGMTGIIQNVPGYTVEDASTVCVKFANGAVGNIASACYFDTDKTPSDIGFTIYCEDARVECDWSREIRLITLNKTVTLSLEPTDHYNSVKTFIEAVRKGDPNAVLSTYADGAKTLKATLAANESMVKKKPVLI